MVLSLFLGWNVLQQLNLIYLHVTSHYIDKTLQANILTGQNPLKASKLYIVNQIEAQRPGPGLLTF